MVNKERARPGLRKDGLIRLLFILTVLKGMLLIVLIPPFQTPDEFSHYDYALYLSKIDPAAYLAGQYEAGSIEMDKVVTREAETLLSLTGFEDIHFHPEKKVEIGLRDSLRLAARFPSRDLDTAASLASKTTFGGAFNYPPLYYLCTSVWLRIADVLKLNILLKFFSSRLISFFLFIAALSLILRSLELMSLKRWVAVIIFTLAAFQPQLAMLSVSIQPDVLALALITLSLYLALRFVNLDRKRDFFLLHITLGLLSLTKIHLFLPTAAGLVLSLALFKASENRFNRPYLLRQITGGLLVFVIGGWWYLRSLWLYDNAIGFVTYDTTTRPFLANVLNWFTYWLPRIYKRFWGEWGWLDYSYPLFVFVILLPLCVLPLFFWARHLGPFLRPPRAGGRLFASLKDRPWRELSLIFTPFALFCLEMVIIAGAISPEDNNQGRMWLPFLFPIVVYLAAFFDFREFNSGVRIFKGITLKPRHIMAVYTLLFLILNLYMIVLTYWRYYPVSPGL